jgi:hypothetical protein
MKNKKALTLSGHQFFDAKSAASESEVGEIT